MSAAPDDLPDPRRITVDLGYLTLHALTWGSESAPLAVCLHGFPDSAWTWRHLGPQLADAGFRVVAPFTRGYAPSGIPADGDYHVAALTHDAIELHRALDGDERAVLIGHDWGAVAANAVSASADAPYERVIALAVPPIPAIRRAATDGVTGPGIMARQALMSWYMAFNQLPGVAERSLGWLIPLLWRRWTRRPTSRATYRLDVDHALAAVPSTAHRSAVLGYYRAALRPRVSSRYAARKDTWLSAPRLPTLYLHGADDGCLQPRFTDYVRGGLPPGSAAAVVAAAGHFLHLDQPTEVNSAIVDFARRGMARRGRGGPDVTSKGSAS